MTLRLPARNLLAMNSIHLALPGGSDLQALVGWSYLCSSLVMAAGYVPQVLRAWRHPYATAVAQSMSSWLLWAACRFVALGYGILVIGDVFFLVSVGLDLSGRIALLLAMLRARQLRRAQLASVGRGCRKPLRCLLLAGCVCIASCQRHSGTHLAAGAATPTPAAAAEEAFQRRVLNVLLLPLIDDDEPPRWAAAAAAADCGAAARVSVDGRPLVAGQALPARSFQLVWSGTSCGGHGDDIVQIAGTVSFWIFHDGDAYSAVVEPERLRVVTVGGAFVLDRRFSASTPLAPPAPEPELAELELTARRAN